MKYRRRYRPINERIPPKPASRIDSAIRMRTNPTKLELFVENCLGRIIKDKSLLQQQAIIHGYIADFYIPSLYLVIEADGPLHLTPEAQLHDRKRDAILEREYGISTLRLSARYLRQNSIDNIVCFLRNYLRNRQELIRKQKATLICKAVNSKNQF